MKDPNIPCWLTKCQQDQANTLLEMGLEFIDSEDLFEEPLWEEAEKVEDWEFITEFPLKPSKKDYYPNGNEYQIYARCTGAIFILYFTSQAENYKESLAEYNGIVNDFNAAKKSIKTISKAYSANFKQLGIKRLNLCTK